MNTFRTIAIRGFPVQRYFLIELAKRLKQRHHSKIHYYVHYPAGLEFYQRHAKGVFDSVEVMYPDGDRLSCTIDTEAVIAQAADYERRYGQSVNRYLLLDRTAGRTFSPAGYYHPRSDKSDKGTYAHVVDRINRTFAFWEREFEAKGITLLINPLFVEADVARRYGAQSTFLSSARYENYHYWTTDEFGYSAEIEEVFRDLEAQGSSFAPEVLERAPHFQEKAKPMLADAARVTTLLRRSCRKLWQHAYWRYRGWDKARQYYVTSELAMMYREWRDIRRLTGPHMPKLNDLQGKRFVYYGLQVEPETSFQGRSPEYFYQLPAIISVARDLPVDVLLVVKEHIAGVGRRPDLFYKQISELKNVVLLDILEPGLEIVRQAEAVVTICGTNGHEAAVLGRPVISLGRHNLYSVMPHVQVVTDEAELRPALLRALDGHFDREQAQRDGARFLRANREICFDMKQFSYLDLKGFDDASVEGAVNALERLAAWHMNRQSGGRVNAGSQQKRARDPHPAVSSAANS